MYSKGRPQDRESGRAGTLREDFLFFFFLLGFTFLSHFRRVSMGQTTYVVVQHHPTGRSQRYARTAPHACGSRVSWDVSLSRLLTTTSVMKTLAADAACAEATPLLRKRGASNSFAGVGFDDARMSGPSRLLRAVVAVAATTALCLGFASAVSHTRGTDISVRLGDWSIGRTTESGSGSLGNPTADLPGDLGAAPYTNPTNIVKYPTPLPDVSFDGKTLLIVMGQPYSGTSALEGLIGTGAGTTDLCKSGSWQCEDTWLLKYMDFPIQPGVDEWSDYYPVDADGYAYAFKHFALTWWDMNMPILMDKTPNLMAHYKTIQAAADKLGVPVKFVLLTRHPFSWNSETHPLNQGLWLELMRFGADAMKDPDVTVHQVKYEDLAWQMDATIDGLTQFLPALGELNPWGSALQGSPTAGETINGDRDMGVAEYFKNDPLDWVPKDLSDEVFAMLCEIGYTADGECEYRHETAADLAFVEGTADGF
jgi:hypothetical protein